MIQPTTLFKIRFMTLGLLILTSLAMLGWGVSRVVRTEALALEWAGDLTDRMAAGLGSAQDIHAQEQSQRLAVVAAATREVGGDDLDTRMANLQRFDVMVQSRREAAKETARIPGKISAVTWWVNPITCKAIALNATKDGRIDPATVAQVKGRMDLDLVIDLARDRAAREAPLSPAERVTRDLSKIQAGGL